MLYLFVGQMFFVKLSIMALYHRIFGVNRTYLRCIYVLLVLHVLWTLAMIILYGLACKPLSKFWFPLSPGTCMATDVQVVAGETVNTFVDFALVVLAMVMIRSINMSNTNKWRLRFLFGLGSL